MKSSPESEAKDCGQRHLGAVTPSGLVALDSYLLSEEDCLSDSRGHSMTPCVRKKGY